MLHLQITDTHASRAVFGAPWEKRKGRLKILSHSVQGFFAGGPGSRSSSNRFSEFPNVHFYKADQTNAAEVTAIVKRHFPDGVDLVIEDASHFGYFSKITFETVFPLVVPGGAYFVEDWGTGYWDSWPDGGRLQVFPIAPFANNIPQRIPSHDFGMVGFVKSLVDLTHESAIKTNESDPSTFPSRIKALEFGEGVCMALKA